MDVCTTAGTWDTEGKGWGFPRAQGFGNSTEQESGELGWRPALGTYWLWASLSLRVFICKVGLSYLSTLPHGVVNNNIYWYHPSASTLKHLAWVISLISYSKPMR